MVKALHRHDHGTESEKDFPMSMNNSVFGKTVESARNHRDIKLRTIGQRRNKLVSEHNFDTTKHFSGKVLAFKIKKARVKMNKTVCPGLLIVDISKIVMYDYWQDIVKPKYGKVT